MCSLSSKNIFTETSRMFDQISRYHGLAKLTQNLINHHIVHSALLYAIHNTNNIVSVSTLERNLVIH